ncbi:MAG TPA: hypothetical protein VGY31_00735 [Terriglobia bacterium]|nr:hypothetical protein [Terriglobia bacterium]
MAIETTVGANRESTNNSGSRLFERHLSPAELAEAWSLSEDIVRRIFEHEPDVPIFENPEKASERRRRTTRIPQSVAERVHRRLSSREAFIP